MHEPFAYVSARPRADACCRAAYLYEKDAQSFHAFWRDTCGRWQPGLYARLKHNCDEYFWLPARREHRGIGGIFFDDMDAESLPDVQQASNPCCI